MPIRPVASTNGARPVGLSAAAAYSALRLAVGHHPSPPRLYSTSPLPQMTAEHGGDTHAAYSEMGKEGGKTQQKE